MYGRSGAALQVFPRKARTNDFWQVVPKHRRTPASFREIRRCNQGGRRRSHTPGARASNDIDAGRGGTARLRAVTGSQKPVCYRDSYRLEGQRYWPKARPDARRHCCYHPHSQRREEYRPCGRSECKCQLHQALAASLPVLLTRPVHAIRMTLLPSCEQLSRGRGSTTEGPMRLLTVPG